MTRAPLSPADQAREAAEAVRARLPAVPNSAIVLGSGLDDFADTLADQVVVSYNDIPHYPATTVAGHAGRLIMGRAGAVPVLAAQGRFHYYEGHTLETVTLPVRLFAQLGVQILILTNAAGCVNTAWQVGDLMAITGHLDYTFMDGPEDPTAVMGAPCHSPSLLAAARRAAGKSGVLLHEGIYTWTLGPSFETPAEIRHIRALGGDAVGMSTVPEIRAAAEAGLQVLGLSCLTNYAAGILDQPLTHQEVLETGRRVKHTFARLLTAILEDLDPS